MLQELLDGPVTHEVLEEWVRILGLQNVSFFVSVNERTLTILATRASLVESC